MQLAIDTSTDIASLALVKDDQLIAELTWRCGQNHTIQLLPNLEYLLRQAKLDLRSVNGIIVARGPGSFNGLRVGLSTAKGLAFSLGIPVVAVNTLEAEAYQHAETGLPICPIFNAGRGEITTAVYQARAGGWQQLVPEHITTLEVLCSQITSTTVFCGEFSMSLAPQLTQRLGQQAIVSPPATQLRRAGFLAELGLKRFKAGDYDEVTNLQPRYLRGPAITRPKATLK